MLHADAAGLVLRDLLIYRLARGDALLDAQPVPEPVVQRLRPPMGEALGRGQAFGAQVPHLPPRPADRDDDARRFRPHDRCDGRSPRETGLRQCVPQSVQLDGGLAGVGILDPSAEQLGVVGVHTCAFPRPRDRHIKLLLGNRRERLRRGDDQDLIDGLALGGV